MKNLTSDVISVVEDLGYSDAILFGHDWGAPIVWNTAALYPDKISAVGALSVPYTGRGPMSSIDLWKMLYKGKFFYQLYFQEEGVAEEEFEKDLKNALELTYFSSDGRGMSFLAENADNPKYQKNVNSKFLDCLPVFNDYPEWINKEELMFFVKEFENSGMRGPLNRYRAQTIDYEELVEAIGLDYVRRGSDLKVSCYTDKKHELESWLEPEYDKFCENVLNPELAESCSYAVVYKKKGLK